MRIALVGMLTLCLLLVAHNASAIQRIQISADSVAGNGWQVTRPSVALQLGAQPDMEIKAAAAELGATKIAQAVVNCSSLVLASGKIECKKGVASLEGKALPFTLTHDLKRSAFTVLSVADSGERWAINGVAAQTWSIQLEVQKGQLLRFAGWIPQEQPRPSGGTLDATINVGGDGATLSNFQVEAKLSNAAFSDTKGLKAGEKLQLSLSAKGKRAAPLPTAPLEWTLSADYLSGEVFWQPVYVAKGGHRIMARGSYAAGVVNGVEANVIMADIGAAVISGVTLVPPLDLREGTIKTGKLNAGPLFDLLIKPFFDKSTFGEVSAEGSVSVQASLKAGTLASMQLDVTDVTLTDPRGRYAIDKLNATLPWRRGAVMQAKVGFTSATLLNVPIGAVALPLMVDENSFRASNVTIPVLDGRFDVRVLEGEKLGETWTWKLSGKLSPISMAALTSALKLPVMNGTLTADIPDMIYAREILAVNGELAIGVFDGRVRGRNIALLEPLGRAPRFLGDFDARNLDLGLITSTFSFGRMEGKVDLDINKLELANWKPVNFDAQLKSSPGSYQKKISQQAVQNISSLGGGGAAAAIQRSMLGFFEQFGYEKLGLTCKLRNGICEMGGVEDTAQGYVIVKGGGIPAITVMGYNRNVGWDTLLSRVQSAISSNAKPVIK